MKKALTLATLLTLVIITSVVSSNSYAHLIDTGTNTAEWHTNGVNISFSGVLSR